MEECTGCGNIRLIVGILAGKGGVGKSSIAFLLAKALKNLSKSVAILDADLYGPSQGLFFNGAKKPISDGRGVVPAEAEGISFMSFSHVQDRLAAMRAPIANQFIEQLISEVYWGKKDFLIVDFPPGTGDIQLSLMQKLAFDGAIGITTPNQLAVSDVHKALEMLQSLHIPLYGIVENMSYLEVHGKKHFPFGKGGGDFLAKEYDVDLWQQIPLLEEISADPSGSTYQKSLDVVIENWFEPIARRMVALLDEEQKGLKEFELKWETDESLIH